MKTNCYEDTYVSVNKARKDVEKLDDVILTLEDADKPLTCRDIGLAIWGADYLDNRRYSARMGQMLKHLRRGGFIRVEEVNGEPVEVEYEEYIREDDDGNPATIRVHDDAGNEYQMPNPKYRPSYGGGKWYKLKRTVIPRIKVYSLVQ